jgi:hypothetical protein
LRSSKRVAGSNVGFAVVLLIADISSSSSSFLG